MRGVFYLQSFYSLLQSLNSLEKLVLQAKENDYDFVALSDDANLYAMLRFFKLCKQHQIKPVLGIKINFLWNNQRGELLIYAKNDQGVKNLIQLSTIAKNADQKNIFLEKITHLGKGLFIIIPGNCSFFEKIFVQNKKDYFHQLLTQLKMIFSDIFLGISLQSFFLEMLADNIMDFAQYFNLSCLPVHKTHYDTAKAQKTYNVLAQMENKKIDLDIDLSFLTKNDFDSKYHKYHETLVSLKKIINSIQYEKYLPQKFLLPSYVNFLPSALKKKKIYQDKNSVSQSDFFPLDSQKYLEKISYEGLKKFFDPCNPKYLIYHKRLTEELKIINDMHYEDYFLIVSDIVKYAKKNGILVGPGRGSSSGSLVCFCLQITEIDPLKYDLIFERFLNPQRKTLPDIDLDFPDDDRDLIINYVCQKYGFTHTASIITFGHFITKKSIIKELIKFIKVMPFQVKGIVDFLDGKLLKGYDAMDDDMKNLLQMASYLEGMPRFTGTHPAGIVLSDINLSQNIPLQKSNYYNLPQTQWESSDLEDIGLLKIDFLGLRSLTLIKQMILMIQQYNPQFCLFQIPLNDTKTFQLFQQAKTMGIFQLESSKAKFFLKKMMPQKFEDLIALLALNRPGPIDSFDIFLHNKKQKNDKFFHPLIDNILKPTYGIILYQEQIMQIVSLFAKYTLCQADLFRRAISKKDQNLLLQEKNHFITKSKQQGHNLELANKIYDYILKFANYGFNKSHSVAYSLLSYRMAYLKANHFNIFITILLNNAINDSLQTSILLKEVAEQNVILVKPHVLTSLDKYYFQDNKLFLPLNIIKGINQTFCQELIKQRQQKAFKSFKDFKQGLVHCLNEETLTNLIFSGALDNMGLNRKTLWRNMDLKEVKYYQYSDNYEPILHQEFLSYQLVERENKSFRFNLNDIINVTKTQ